MKRVVWIIVLILFIGMMFVAGLVFVPARTEITGVKNFSENDCQFGLNVGLLPDNSHFLSNYAYTDGIYHYLLDQTYEELEVKTFVLLQYSEDIYRQAKAAAMKQYTVTIPEYTYERFTFFATEYATEANPLDTDYPGVRMFGFDDASRTLIFLGYLNPDNTGWTITTDSFREFFQEEFSVFRLNNTGDASMF